MGLTAAETAPESAGRRMAWGTVDQGLSSLSNFLLVAVVAHATSRTAFGAFALLMAVYLIVDGLCQAVASTPLAVLHTGHEAGLARATSRATGTALVMGLLAGALLFGLAPLTGSEVAPAQAALALGLGGLTLQDAWRFAFVAQGRPARAVLNDTVCAAVQLVTVAALLASHVTTAAPYVLAWSGAAAVAALLGCLQARVWPAPLGVVAWLRATRALAPRFALETLLVRASTQLTLFGVAGIVGLAGVAAIRGAQLLFSPLNLVYLGALLSLVPELVRVRTVDPARLLYLGIATSLGAVLCVLCLAAALVLLPSAGGGMLLGDTWSSARPLLLAVALQNLAIASTIGPQVTLKALAAARQSLRSHAVHSLLIVVGAVAGSLAHGAEGAAFGIAAGTTGGAIVWWHALHGQARLPRRGASPAIGFEAG